VVSARAAIAAAAAAVVCAAAAPAGAKRFGFATPGRDIYERNETYAGLLDQNRRKWVAEVAVGSGPEGNLGVTLGYLLNVPRGFELYAGFGTRTSPALHYTGAFRYFLPVLGSRAYLGGGYVLQQHTKLDLRSHSVFGELGYKWRIKHTFHMTISAGVQEILHTTVSGSSALRDDDVNPGFLEQELDELHGLRLLLALRLSRAF
jgi:hypothetical protein